MNFCNFLLLLLEKKKNSCVSDGIEIHKKLTLHLKIENTLMNFTFSFLSIFIVRFIFHEFPNQSGKN
jgi:hypothetical protein